MTSAPQTSSPEPIISAAVDVEGRASTAASPASAGLCLADDCEGPMDIAQISATLERRDRAGKEEAKRDDRPSSTSSSARVGFCPVDDDEGPINIAQISATLEQQDRAEKAEAQRINSQTSYDGPSSVQGAAYDDGGPSASSTSANLICQSQVDEGPMDTAEIAPLSGRQERAKTANDRINRESTPARSSQTGNPHDMARSDLSLMGGDRLEELSDEDEENRLGSGAEGGNSEVPVQVVVPNDADVEGGDYLVEAYKVSEEKVYEATPALPWFKQRRTKLLMAAILALLAVLAVSLSVAFTREPVLKTNEPTFSPAPSASSTSMPSISSAPSLSCESKVLATKKQFDLRHEPKDIKDIKVSIDGVDAAVVWHDGKPAKLYVYFFQLSERTRDWGLVAPFQEDLTTALGKDDFGVSMSGNVAVVGVFLENKTITYQSRGNNWKESIRMNLPDMTSFSFRDGLLVVMAGVCNFMSCTSKASFFKQSNDNWLVIDEMAIDDGDYFDALIDGELVVLRHRTGVREDDCSSSFYKLIEGEIVMQDQRPIEGCGQMVMDEGLLAHAVDGGVAMYQEDGSVFVANHSGEATDLDLKLSLHKNVLAVAGLRGDKIKVFSNGTGEDRLNWTEILELDVFNADLLLDSFDVFNGFLTVIDGHDLYGHDLFTFDLSRCTPARTVIPAEKEIAEDSTGCYNVSIWCVGEDWTASVENADDGESVGKTLRPDVPSNNKHFEQLCLFEGQYKFKLQMKTRAREYKVRLNVPRRDRSLALGRVLLRGGLTGDEFIESALWVPFDLDSPENRFPTPVPTSDSTFDVTPTVGTNQTLIPTPDPPTRRPETPFPTVSDGPSISNEPTLVPSTSARPSDSTKPSSPPSMSLTPTAKPSAPPSQNPSDKPTSRPSEEPRHCITIRIVYDYFPTETSWKLISDEDGTIVHEYKETDDTATSHFDRFCLTEGWYTFKVFDKLGDGISDEDNGQGSYTIASDDNGWSNGIILARGGEFADVDAANFVLPYVMPSIAPSSSKTPTASPTLIPSLSPSTSKKPSASPTFIPSLPTTAEVFVSTLSPTVTPEISTPFPTFPVVEVLTLSPTVTHQPSASHSPSMAPSSTAVPSVSISPTCGEFNLIMSIVYDSYPEETSYKLEKIASEDGQENILASFHSGSRGDKNHDEFICLGDGLYMFSVYDSFGNGFNGEYSLTLVPGETIVKRDNLEHYGERVQFRIPFDKATLDVRTIGSDGQLLTLAPTNNPTASNKPTLRPTNYPSTSTYRGKLLAPDGAALDYFGVSVAIYGDTIVVGAFGDDDRSGSAYVFVRREEEWTHQAKLLAPDGASFDWFGGTVAIYGDAIVVGATGDDENGLKSGSAHVFVRSGEEWTHQAKLLAPDGAEYVAFGDSVAIYGDTIAVGAHWDDDNNGSAHVFVRSGEEWTHQAKLLAPNADKGDLFGGTVAIYGDAIVVGAYGDDDNGSYSGSAHVFVRSGEEWTHQAKLLAPDAAKGDWFGYTVAIYGDTIAVGAYRDDDNGSDSGSARVFVV